MMKNEEGPFLDHSKIAKKALGQVQNGMLPSDSVNAGPGAEIIDVDALISSGGLEIDDDEIVSGNTPKKLFSSFNDALASLDDDEVKDAEPKAPTDKTNPAPASLLNDDKKNDNSSDNDDVEKKQKQKNSITKIHNNNLETSSAHKEFTLVKSKKSPPTTLDLAIPKAHTAKWRNLDATHKNLGPVHGYRQA
jgi:hypothetical protein